MKLSERDLQSIVVDTALVAGWKVYCHPDSRKSAGLSTPGFPDLVLVKPGRLLFVELKRDGKNPRPEQEAWLALLGGIPGVEAYCWRPSQLDSVREVLL